tara:strand:- start:40 stop:693 length:654 start_codon:yes stop_codon:yes gene_type:complete
MDNTRCQYVFKIIIIGNTCVGKSSLLLKYTRDIYTSYYEPTIGVDFGTKIVQVPNNDNQHIPIKLQLWDTAGQERFRTITQSYYKGTCGVIVVFDLTNKESFKSIENWFKEIDDFCEPDISIILIGNKCDLKELRVVTDEEIENIIKHYNVKYFETSALELDSTSIAFNILAQDIYTKMKKSGKIPKGIQIICNDNSRIVLSNKPYKKSSKKMKCCN